MGRKRIAAILAALSVGCAGVPAPSQNEPPYSVGGLPPGPLRGMVVGGAICIVYFLWLEPVACGIAVIGGGILDTANAINRSIGAGKI